mgnify:CR=1 FL=1
MKIFNLQTKSITSSALVLGIASAFSAFSGLLRDRLLAGRFGVGDELDIYYAAFRIPDFISMILIMGSISAAIVPIFSGYLTRNKDEAWKFLSNLFNLIIFILVLVSIVLIIFTPQLVSLITPGFSEEKKAMVSLITRIMFLSPIILGISNIISSVLQVFRRFLIASLSPIIYNFGIIAGILFLAPRFGVAGLAMGVVFGALLHLLIQVPVLFKIGFKFSRIFNFSDPGFKKVLKLTLPRSLGLAASQVNLFVIIAIASTLASGSIAIFNLAESLSRPFFILGGISFSTAAFPQLALSFSREKRERFQEIYSKTFSKIILLIIPLSLILFFFRDFLVGIILRAGKFGLVDSRLTAASLGLFAIGLFAKSLVLLIVKAFYALQDSKTPAKASILAMVANVSLCFLFLRLLSFENSFKELLTKSLSLSGSGDIRILGLPLALSLASIIQFLFLYFFFKKKMSNFNLDAKY